MIEFFTFNFRTIFSFFRTFFIYFYRATHKLRVAIRVASFSRVKKIFKLLIRGRVRDIWLRVSYQLNQYGSVQPDAHDAGYTLRNLLNKTSISKVDCKCIDIVIPIFNGLVCLQPLIESLLKNTTSPYRLIFVDDCSTDREVLPLLRKYSSLNQQILLIENDENIGFVGSVNRVLKLVSSDIFVILNSDTEVPENWLNRLLYPILADPQVASATPFSNSATICSFPNFLEDNDLYLGMSLSKIDSAFSELGALEKPIYMPTSVGFCMAINRTVVEKIGMFDIRYGRGYGEENDWSMRATASGYKHVLVHNLFVYHKHGGSFSSNEKLALMHRNHGLLLKQYPNYDNLVSDYIKLDPAKSIRQFIKLKLSSDVDGHGAVMIIDHNLGGGANHYRKENVEFYESIGRPVLILIDDSRKKSLYLEVMLDKELYKFNLGDLSLLDEIFDQVRIDDVIYNNLVGSSSPLGVIKKIVGLQTKFKFKLISLIHDFYPVCPSFTLLNSSGRYCGVPSDKKVCDECLPKIPSRVCEIIPSNVNVNDWRISWHRMLSISNEIRCFSENSREILLRAYPSVADKTFVSPHVMKFKPKKPLIKLTSPTHIGILGGINYAKGLDVVLNLLGAVRKSKKDIQVTVFGEINAITPIAGLNVTGRYDKKDLSNLIEASGANIFLFPSIWPETFSFVTSELIEMDMPLLCFNLGAPADRVREYKKGMVVPLETSVENLLNYIVEHHELCARGGK